MRETVAIFRCTNLLQAKDDLGTVEAEFTYEPLPYGHKISQNRDTDSSFYHFDGINNTSELTDDTGSVSDEYRFDAWGKLTSSTGSTANPFGYKGKVG